MSGGSSYNGWPASDSASAIGVDKGFEANGITFPGGVKAGDVSKVLGYVFCALDERVEAAVPGWCWGWDYRPNVNNPSSLSNHASATAGDYNAPNHPNGGSRYEGFTDSQVAEIRRILDEVEGVIRWGADYSGTKDAMHFEVNCDAATLAGVADRLGDTDMGLTADDKEYIRETFADELRQALTVDLLVSTDDEAADGNPNKYTIASGVARDIRLTSFAATGQILKPH
jgi:hypothetical protein